MSNYDFDANATSQQIDEFNSVDYSRAHMLSARSYNLVISGLLFIGFCVMAIGSYFTGTMAFQRFYSSLGGAFAVLIGSLVLSVGGMLMISSATKNQSVGLAVAGYVIFIVSFGFTASLGLAYYDLPTIQTAFAVTAGITLVFGALGLMFPAFFQKLTGIVFGALLAVCLVEIVLAIMGVHQTITDWIVIAIFSVFIARDTYIATTVPPTLPNAIMMACQLYADVINVLLRVLSLLGNDRD